MKKLYDVVSKATKINKITGAEIPAEVFHGPYMIVGHDEEHFYVQYGDEWNFYPEGVEGCGEIVPRISGFLKSQWKLVER